MSTNTNHDTLQNLKLMLARWKNPTAWDHIAADEPLDPIKGEWVSDVACSVSSNGDITIPVGATVTSGSATFIVADYAQTEMRIASVLMDSIAEKTRALARSVGDALAKTMVGQAGMWPDTSSGGQGEPTAQFPEGIPYPRNREERRILKSIIPRLPSLIRQAEKKFGPRDGDSEWNDKFWKMVARPQVERRKTMK